MNRDGAVIVGGGLAGQRCAQKLRGGGYDRPIRMVCAESEPPYDRPPLSKGVLAGTVDEGKATLRPPTWYEDNEIELLLGTAATRLDAQARILALDDGAELPYGSLLIATGSRPRSIPALEGMTNVHFVRTLDDVRALRSQLDAGVRLAIIGGGFIGQEVAATARGLGVEVAIIEALDAPLGGMLGERVGRWLVDLHADEGTRMELSARVERVRGTSRVEELVLADGRRLACDVVVVGVGVIPATDWLAGTALADEVRTDTAGRTALPNVFAAGDAAVPFEPRIGMHRRVEHWEAAAHQGAAAAQAMMGIYPGTPPLPSFWSDQYGVRIQYVGHADRAGDVLVEGDPDSRDFSAIFFRSGSPVAALLVGRPRALPQMRELIELAYQGRAPELTDRGRFLETKARAA